MAIDIRGMAPLLQVFDMPAALRFYRDVLGFEVVSSSAPGEDCDWVLLSNNGVELMLNTTYEADQRPSRPDPGRVQVHSDTVLYFGCADMDGAYNHLVGHGFRMNEPQVTGYGMRQLYVKDPDGYNLCFQWPASREMKEQWRERYGALE